MHDFEERDVPASAFCFASESIDLEGGEADNAAPIRMVARSGQPIEDHWYFGKIVHDMSGFKLHKSVLPIDYVHEEEIGYLDHFEVDGESNLVVSGKLIMTSSSDDRARKVVERAKGGVPYEASIDWSGDGSVIEQIPEGFTTEVNGYQFEGPGYIVREWPLRGVAVCPYGADMHTESTLLSKTKKPELMKCKFIKANTTENKEVLSMSDIATEQPIDEAVVVMDETGVVEAMEEVAAVESTELSVRKEAAKFLADFGQQGAVWFAEGLTYEQAKAREREQLKAENDKLKQQVADLGKKFASDEPVSFQASDKKTKGFASRINLPY